MTSLTLSRALNEGLRKAMENDAKVLIMGEDVGKLGGVFRVTDGLQKDFGEDRVTDTPLAESGIIGTAIGLALRGYRPVCEIQFDGFVFPAFDQIVCQLAKMAYRSLGKLEAAGHGADTVRRRDRRRGAPQRVTRGAVRPHRRPAGRGLRRPVRRVRDDPAGDQQRRPGHLLRAEAPVLGQEPRSTSPAGSPPRRRSTKARTLVSGDDVTLLCYGPMVRTCVEAATAARRGRALGRGDRPAVAVAA